MNRLSLLLQFLTAMVATVLGTQALAQNEPKSSPIIVQGRQLTFDPKTCTEGKGMVSWGNGSARVTVLGHREGHCLFDYEWEVEGGGNYRIHRIRVPVDSCQVVVDAERHDGKGEEYWSVIFTSFTERQAKLVRKSSFGWLEDLVEGTEEFVAYRTARRGNPDNPVADGEKVSLRFILYTGKDFTKQALDAKQGESVRLTLGKGRDWAWARTVAANMDPGEIRQIRLPSSIAGAAKEWLPGAKDDEALFLEMEMVVAAWK